MRLHHKYINIFITILFLLISGNICAQHPALSGGNGSKGDPYLIGKSSDLTDLATYVNDQKSYSDTICYYELTADIDMSGINYVPIICTGNNLYTCDFNGNNHAINNLTITGIYTNYGLIGAANSKSRIHHLKLTNINYNRPAQDETLNIDLNVGGIVGRAQGATIDSCYISGKINLVTYCPANIGGVIGTGISYVNVKYCESWVNIYEANGDETSSSDYGIGGIMGFGKRDSIIGSINCGNLYGSRNIGGIIGFSKLPSVINKCSNLGDITFFDNYAGGIIGIGNSAQISNCSNAGNLKISLEGVDDTNSITISYCGGIAGNYIASTTNTSNYPLCNNLNVGHIEGWNYVGGISGYMSCHSYNNINAGSVSSLSSNTEFKKGAICSSYSNSYISKKEVLDLFYDAQMSGIEDSLNGDKTCKVYSKLCSQMVYDSLSSQLDTFLETQMKDPSILSKWTFSKEFAYPIPNTTNAYFNELAASVIRLNEKDKWNDVNHQFRIMMPTVDTEEQPTMTTASKGKICRITANNVGLYSLGSDTIILQYNGYTRKIPLIINTIDTLMFSGGEGTTDNPYIIANLKDLKELRKVVNNNTLSTDKTKNWTYNKYFQQYYDIEDGFNGIIGLQDSSFKNFEGHYDGNGKSIYLTVDTNTTKAALFAELNESVAEIHDLEVYGHVNGGDLSAGIVGVINGGSLKNCLNSVNVTAAGDTAGGICAKAYNAQITENGNNGFVKCNKLAGGIVGYAKDCHLAVLANAGSVTTKKMSAGIAGSIVGTELDTAVNYGYVGRNVEEIEGTTTDAICANNEGTLSNTYYNLQMTDRYDSTYNAAPGLTTAELTDSSYIVNALGAGWTNKVKGTSLKGYLIPKTLKDFNGAKLLSLPLQFQKYNTAKDVYQTLKVVTDYVVVLEATEGKFGATEEGEVSPSRFGYDTLSVYWGNYQKIIPLFSSYGYLSGGAGTAENPYIIAKIQDYKELATDVQKDYFCTDTLRNASWHKHFKQTTAFADIVKTIIGNDTKERYNFNGYYDGNGNTITVDITNGENTGLFAAVSKGGSVKNIHLKGKITGSKNTGSIAGVLKNGEIQNCVNTATITGSNNVGGLTGLIRQKSILRNSLNLGTINGENYVGGLVGRIDTSDMRYCVNAGLIKASSDYAGGLTGMYNWGGESNYFIFECFNTSVFENNLTHSGALIGYRNNTGTSIRHLYYDNQLTTQNGIGSKDEQNLYEGLSTKSLIGDSLKNILDTEIWLFGDSLYPRVSAIESEENILAASAAIFASNENYLQLANDFKVSRATAEGYRVGWSSINGHINFEGDSAILIKSKADTLRAELGDYTKLIPVYIVAELFSGGKGTAERPYKITCKKDMEELAMYVNTNILALNEDQNWSTNKYFSLENDIPADSVITTIIGENYTGSNHINFNGTFEGHGHKITIAINNGTKDNTGVFGYLEGNAVIDSLEVEGQVIGTTNVGSITGYANTGAKIQNCINNCALTGSYYVGGIAGYNKGILSHNSNAGNIVGNGNMCGCIVGYSEGENANIYGAANTGNIESKNYAGGIAGSIKQSKISCAINAGRIVSEKNLGGIAGQAKAGTIDQTLNVGEIKTKGFDSQIFESAICGSATSSTITQSYYDKKIIKTWTDEDSSNTYAQAKTTKELVSNNLKANFTDVIWNFSTNRYPKPQTDTVALLASSTIIMKDDNTTATINDYFDQYSYVGITSTSILKRFSLKGNRATLLSMGLDTLDFSNGDRHRKIALDIICITQRTQDTLTDCDSVLYEGTYYTENKEFNDTLKNANGCDSIVGIKIIVNKSSAVTTNKDIYASEQYKYNQNIYTDDQLVTDTLTNKSGCDSIVKQQLWISHAKHIYQNEEPACDSLTFEGITYYKNDSVIETQKDIHGRDSIITHTYLTLHYSTKDTLNKTGIDSVEYNGEKYYSDAMVVDTFATKQGCDSLVYGQIKVLKTSHSELWIEGCEWVKDHNTNLIYTQDTLVNDTLTNKVGVDSIIKINIIVHKTVIDTIYKTNCYAVVYKGNTYRQDTVIDENYQTQNGCDSIIRIILHPIQPSVYDTSYSACKLYNFRGKEYLESTLITDTLTGKAYTGCDSIVNHHINIYKPSEYRDTVYGCVPFVYGNLTLEKDTTIKDTLTNYVGCDSMIYHFIDVTKTIYDTTVVPGCEEAIYDGMTFTEDATLTHMEFDKEHPLQNCPIRETTVFIKIGNYKEHTTKMDNCESYTFRGQEYTNDTLLVDSFISVTGCDSLEKYKITIHKSGVGYQSVNGCEVAYYKSKPYRNDTIITEHTETLWGCDSTTYTTVHVGRPDDVYTSEENCDSVLFEGKYYKNDTTIDRQYSNMGGCDSIVHHNLIVYHPTYFTTTIDSAYQVTYNGRRYARSTVLHDTLINVNGCDSFVTIAIVIENSLDYPIIVNKYGYMLLCNNNIGQDKYKSYQWYKNGSIVHGATKAYYEEDGPLNGCYQVYVNTTDGQEYFSESLCIEQEKEMQVYPNPIAQGQTLSIDYEFTDKQKNGLYLDIYNTAGILVYNTYPREFPIEIPVTFGKGYYFVLITTGEDKIMGTKFIVK